MNDEALRRHFRRLYFLALTVPFFWQLPTLLGLSVAYPVREAFRPVVLCLGGMAVTGLWLTGRQRRPGWDGVILLAAFGWICFVFLLHRQVLGEAGQVFQRAALAWLVFYPFGYLLEDAQQRSGLLAVAACWVSVMTLLASLGLVCAATGTAMENLSGSLTFGMLQNRLQLGIWATSTSENLLTAWMLAAVGLAVSGRRIFFWPLVVLFAAMALTDGRNGILSMGIFAGSAAFVAMQSCWKGRRLAGCLLGAVLAAACVAVVYFGAVRLQKCFPNSYRQVVSLRRMVLPEEQPALRMAAKIPASTHRRVDATLNGRVDIWRDALRAFRRNEGNVLLLGRPGSVWTSYAGAEHLHNIYLQVTAEFGLVGAGLTAAFLALFAISGWRLVFCKGAGLWRRMLPVPGAVLLISELADAFTRFAQENAALYVLFLFLGLTMSWGRLQE